MVNDKTRSSYEYFLSQGFKPVTTNDLALLKQYDGESRLFQLRATVGIDWAFASGGSYKVILGYLCSVWFLENGTYFCIQNNNNVKASVKEIVDMLYDLCMKAELPDFKVNFIDEPDLELWTSIDGYEVNVEYDENLSDYVYHPEDILDVTGNTNRKRRCNINKFKEMADVTFCDLTPRKFLPLF